MSFYAVVFLGILMNINKLIVNFNKSYLVFSSLYPSNKFPVDPKKANGEGII